MKIETTDSPRSTANEHRHAPLWLVVTAFALVYVIWGSTYLGIRYAVESIPPFLAAGARHFAAGLALFVFARARGAAAPSLSHWRDAIVAGLLMLVIGNGGVTWAEQRIPSGVAALLVGLTPLWMVFFDWIRPAGPRPRPFVAGGLVVGFAGVALLARGQGEAHEPAYAWSVAALMAASIGWAAGSVFNRSARKPASPFLGVAMQMISGGAILLILATVQGELKQFSVARMTTLSFGAWLYLTIAGSLIAYTAYIWLLHASTPARVATYAYVNPLIAVLLGCTLGRETFSHELFVAAVLIIVAVVLIVRGSAQASSRSAAPGTMSAPASESP
jgi:drug/metabolite transporter (DMT)-like permease